MKRLVAKLSVSLGALFVMAMVAEGMLRVMNPFDLDWRMAEHHPVRIETLSPNFEGSYRGARVRTNQFGHRVPTSWAKSYTLEKPPGTRRILVFGDSFTFGEDWPAEVSFVEQLQQRLDPGGARIQVLNFGVPGYCPLQELNYIEEEALRFQPDAVVVQVTDANDFQGMHPLPARSPIQGVKTWLRRHLYLYSVVWDVWFHGRDSALAKAWVRWAHAPSRTPAPEAAFAASLSPRPSNPQLLANLRRGARAYYQQLQAQVEQETPGWRQASESYQEMGSLFAEHRVPFIIMVATPLWDLECAAWNCQSVTLRYHEVAEEGQAFYRQLADRLGRFTPHYLSLERAFGPYTLEQLCDGKKGHYGPKKNAIVAAQLTSLLKKDVLND